MHHLPKLILTALLFPLLSAAAVAAGPPQAPLVPIDRVVAVVNNGVITERQLQQRLSDVKAELQAQGASLPSESALEHQVLNSMIMDRIQLDLATMNGIQAGEQSVNDALARIAQNNNLSLAQLQERVVADGRSWKDFTTEIRHRLVIQKVQQRMVNERIQITDQEVHDFLAQHANQLDPGLKYHLAQILVPIPGAASPKVIQTALNEAVKLRKEAIEGKDFEKLAIAHSAGQHALQGGDLGWLSADELPTYFVRQINVMKPGDISQPIRSPSGFHLVKLLGERGGKEITVTQTHVRQILIKVTPTTSNEQARAKLERLRHEIEQGLSFATLAKANSDDTGSASDGGDLGWVSPGELVPQFQKVMDDTSVGQISQPFRSPYGWHILQVLGRRQVNSTREMVQAQAKKLLFERKQREALNIWLRRIRDQAYVRVMLKPDNGQSAAQATG